MNRSHLINFENAHLWLMGILLAALCLTALPVMAQDTTVTDDEVNAIAKQLYCPVCENIPLDTCGTPACIQWRGEIRTQLEAGETPAQVIADFVQRFGDRVVGTPQDPTLRALSLVTPYLVGALLLVGIVSLLLRWRQAGVATAGGTTPTRTGAGDDDYRNRIEADLRTRR